MEKLLKRNVSTLLLLTPLEMSYGVLDYYNLEEAFIADIDREDLHDCVICLFKIYHEVFFQNFLETTLEQNEHYLEDYDYNGYVAVAFKFPEKYLSDLEIIKEGRYSEVSYYTYPSPEL